MWGGNSVLPLHMCANTVHIERSEYCVTELGEINIVRAEYKTVEQAVGSVAAMNIEVSKVIEKSFDDFWVSMRNLFDVYSIEPPEEFYSAERGYAMVKAYRRDSAVIGRIIKEGSEYWDTLEVI